MHFYAGILEISKLLVKMVLWTASQARDLTIVVDRVATFLQISWAIPLASESSSANSRFPWVA